MTLINHSRLLYESAIDFNGLFQEEKRLSYHEDTAEWSYNIGLSNLSLSGSIQPNSSLNGSVDYGSRIETKVKLFNINKISGINILAMSTSVIENENFFVDDNRGILIPNSTLFSYAPSFFGNQVTRLTGEIIYFSRTEKPSVQRSRSSPEERIDRKESHINSTQLQLDSISRTLNSCFRNYPPGSQGRIDCLLLVREACTTPTELIKVDNIVRQQTVIQGLMQSSGARLEPSTEGRPPTVLFPGGETEAREDFNTIVERLGGGDLTSFESSNGNPALRTTLEDGTELILRQGDSREDNRFVIEFQARPKTKLRYEGTQE